MAVQMISNAPAVSKHLSVLRYLKKVESCTLNIFYADARSKIKFLLPVAVNK